MAELFLGIDLGGTFIKAGVVDGTGKILGHVSVPTGKGEKEVVANMITSAHEALKAAGRELKEIAAVGVDSPGPLDMKKGVVIKAPNIEGFANVQLRAQISAALGKRAILENDANAAGYGEYWAGAGKTSLGHIPHMTMITLGTGVGSGVVIDGHVLHGEFGFAAEVGHMILIPDGILCSCGQKGCVERYCSATTMAQRGMEKLAATDRASSLRAVLKEKGKLSSKDFAEAAQAGDAVAVEHWETTCRYLAMTCVSVIRVLDPELIVIGGGLIGAGEFLRGCVEKHLKEIYWNMTPVMAKVALAKLGNDAGVVGAAGVAKDALKGGWLAEVGM